MTNVPKFSLSLEEDQYTLNNADTDESTALSYELSYLEFLEACGVKMKDTTTNLWYDIESVVKDNILNDEDEYRRMRNRVRRTKSVTVSTGGPSQ